MSGHLQYVLLAIINKVLHNCHTMNKMNNVLFIRQYYSSTFLASSVGLTLRASSV